MPPMSLRNFRTLSEGLLVNIDNMAEKQVAAVETPANAPADGKPDTTGLRLVNKQDIDGTALFYNAHKDSVEPLPAYEQRRMNRKNVWCLLTQTWWVAFLNTSRQVDFIPGKHNGHLQRC